MSYQDYAVRIVSNSLLICLLFCISSLTNVYAEIQIKHDEVSAANSGKRIGLNSEVTAVDKQGIKTVRAYFKADGAERWHYVPMDNDGTGANYAGQLPAPDVHTKQVDYRLLAVNGANEIAKTDIFSIKIDPDKTALARLKAKPPTDIKIDVSAIEEARDRFKEIEDYQEITEADQESEKNQRPEPSTDSRVAVRSEYKPDVIDVPGFNDYIDMYFTGSSDAYGVTAGIVESGSSVAGATGSAASATNVAAATAAAGGIGGGAVLGGLVLAGAAAGASSSGGGDSGGTTAGTDGSVSSRNVPITVTDHNNVQDDFYDLYVNGTFIGPVNNPPGGSTTYNVTLNGGANTILLQLTALQGSNTALEISINSGEFRQTFSGSNDHSWTITAP